MPLRINTLPTILPVQRHLDQSQQRIEKSYAALASGSRIVRAADDAAGFAIAEGLKAQLGGTKQAESNARSAQAMLNTAEGGLNEQANIIIRLRELAVQAASDTVGDDEREFLDQEFQSLTSEFDRISKTTRFGAKQLLSGSGESFDFHVGAYGTPDNVVHFKLDADTSASSVGLSGLDVTDKGNANDALEDIDDAQLKVGGVRATFGAVQSRFDHVINSLQSQAENIAQAHSVIADTDVAEEVSNLTNARITQEAGIAVLAQANQGAASVIKLIA